MGFLKGAVIFTFGVGTGIAGSYIIFKKKYDEREEDLRELKEHYNKKLYDEIDKKVAENIIEKQGYVSYDRVTPNDIKTTIKEVEEEAIMKEGPREDYPDEAFIIDETEYSERELYFEKVELDYYTEDECLVDEGNELTDVDSTVGWDILEKFKNDENSDTIYVRNAKLNTDYLINKNFGGYSDISGLGGDDTND